MRTQTFADMGYFDEGTFLFGEEYILGEKLRRLGKALILDPQECVRHFQGASTGFGTRRRPDRRMHRFRAQSTIYFAENYLHVGPVQRMALKVALTIGFAVRVAAWLPTRFVEGTRSLVNLFRKHAA
jgi:GT2 family glycosyltransferase